MTTLGRLAGLVILTLGLLLVLVGLLGRFGILADWGDRIAEQRNSLREGGPIFRSPEANVTATPVPLDDLATALTARPNLSTAQTLLSATAIAEELPKPSTLFLPSNQAFAELPPDALAALQNNPDVLAATLRHHVVRGRVPAAEIVRFSVLPTLNGTPIPVDVANTTIGGANITAVNQPFADGLIQVIDRVLLPSNNLTPPRIDTPEGQPRVSFKGDFLTVVGSAEPFTRVVLNSNGQPFGEAVVSAEGRWEIPGAIPPGSHTLIAYMLNNNPESPLPLAISGAIILDVEE